MSATAEIVAAIRDRGPIPFDEFMELALYGPRGFFRGEVLRSTRAGDFLTSPEVSPLFGLMLGRFVELERSRLGEPFRLVEAGAGSGSLLASMPDEVRNDAWAVEVSPPARSALAHVVQESRVVDAIDDALGRGVVLANELLDNLPMAVVVRRGNRWAEHRVGLTGERLEIVETEARDPVAAWADAFSGPVRDGGLVEVQLAASDWITKVLEGMGEGTLVVVDYGGSAKELEHRRQSGTLRTYRAHHLGPEPLLEPGETDITADVNFSAAEAAAAATGAAVEIHRQDDFLAGLGLRNELSKLRHDELDAARRGDELARLQIRSERTNAEALLNPRGLGDFRVMIARR